MPMELRKQKRQLALPFSGSRNGQSGWYGLRTRLAVLLAEFFHSASGIHDLLLPRIERVAL
jgi:hypothetical protein